MTFSTENPLKIEVSSNSHHCTFKTQKGHFFQQEAVFNILSCNWTSSHNQKLIFFTTETFSLWLSYGFTG